MNKITAYDIAQMIDHSLLNPKFTRQEVEAGCRLAAEYECITVCVKPCDVRLAYGILKDTRVLTTTVIGFPHGSNLAEIKVAETKRAIDEGCKEIDMVINIGRFLSGDYNLVQDDIAAVCEETHRGKAILKVILENAYLSAEQIKKACELCVATGADFTKSSTGYAPYGARICDLRIMRASTPPSMQVKAAGGVRTLDDALSVRAIGVTRFGCTTTAQMIQEARKREASGELIVPIPENVQELSYLKSAAAPQVKGSVPGLIIERDVIKALMQNEKTLYCTIKGIISPAAADLAKEKGITISRL
ncbi:MAG: deoxyribose-phosphate aldolase [Treponema sp.]|jgi:deoxyribose-phosphate aldolase|nr:deoxyribose-phosphate aldolase [Treponema sp.]